MGTVIFQERGVWEEEDMSIEEGKMDRKRVEEDKDREGKSKQVGKSGGEGD